MSCSMAMAAMASRSARERTPPVGLAGLLKMIRRVVGDQRAQLVHVEPEVVRLAAARWAPVARPTKLAIDS